MSGDIPQWAKERAAVLTQEQSAARGLDNGGYYTDAMRALAAYIAEHEDPPVDPLLIEARKIAAHSAFSSRTDAIYAGEMDGDPHVRTIVAALKRGIEIGKEAR